MIIPALLIQRLLEGFSKTTPADTPASPTTTPRTGDLTTLLTTPQTPHPVKVLLPEDESEKEADNSKPKDDDAHNAPVNPKDMVVNLKMQVGNRGDNREVNSVVDTDATPQAAPQATPSAPPDSPPARAKRVLSMETRQKMRERKLGIPRPDYVKRKIADALIRRTADPAIPKRVHGRASDETRQKMRESKLGIPRSEETRQKISLSMSGRKVTATHRQNMVDSHCQRFPGCPEGMEWLRLTKWMREQPENANRRNYWKPMSFPVIHTWQIDPETWEIDPHKPPVHVASVTTEQYHELESLMYQPKGDPADRSFIDDMREYLVVGFRPIRGAPTHPPHMVPSHNTPIGTLVLNGYFRLSGSEPCGGEGSWHKLRVGNRERRVLRTDAKFLRADWCRSGWPSLVASVLLYDYTDDHEGDDGWDG